MGKIVVCEIIGSLINRGGAEVFFYNLCRTLSLRDDIELHVVSLFDNVHPSFGLLREELGNRFVTLGKHKGFDFSCALRLRRLLKKIKPKVINTHLSVEPTLLLGSYSLLGKTKIVHTYHTIVSEESDRFIRQFYAKNLISFVGISPMISQGIMERFPKAQTRTIMNGIPLKTIERGASSPDFDVICVAGFRLVKDHAFLLDAFSDKSFTSRKLLLVGDGPEKENIVQKVQELDIGDQVLFAGSVDDVYPYLANASLFVLTSQYEGNPISVLEAMSAGLPIVAPRVGGIPDVVANGKNGFLYVPRNRESFIRCVTSILTNPDLAKEIGKTNCKDAQKYSIEACADQYMKFFYELIS